jgi:ABC-type dipeptide/oligopeptide/nickel transport system permease subunit
MLGSFFKRFFRIKNGVTGIILIAVPLIMAIAPSLIAPYNPWVRSDIPFLRPNDKHLLGTNDIGQDLFSELVYGARISMMVGFLAAASTVVIGTIIGLLAGYLGGIVDELLIGVTDVVLLLPGLPLMIVLAALLGQGYQNMIFVIAITSWPGVARMIRSQVLSIKEQAYIEAARALGCNDTWIISRHVLPQVIPLALANIIIRIGGAMVAEASLSFLGLGDPTQKSWGTILYWAQRTGAFSLGAWWWIIPPGIMITISVLAFTQMGFAVEQIVNPKLRRT